MQEQKQMAQNYSLEADMATGWKPKMKIIGPMPLNFDNPSIDNLIKPLVFSETSIHEVVYLGLRPRDTFEMHSFLAKNYRYKYRHLLNTDYSHLKPFFRKFYSQFEPLYKMPFHGMNPKIKNNIIFESRFQSGNLDYAVRIKTNQYDLFIRIDSNTCGHIMWYDFKVKNSLDKTRTIRLNICNLRRSKNTYDQCLQPYIYRHGRGWKQQCNNLIITEDRVRFYKDHLIFSNEEAVQPNIYRKLSFDLELRPHEEVEIAYSIPYTYSQLLEDIKKLKNQASKNPSLDFDVDFTNVSLSGLEIPHIKISAKNENEENPKKQSVLIIGRQHPGQSNGSHVLKGFMEELVRSTEKNICQLRNLVNFHIIPMLNPDGVVIGNFRTSLYGKDLNRLFRKNQTFMIPQIELCKNAVFQITKKKKRKMFMFLDFHGHSAKKNAFCFAPSTFEMNSVEDVREFPKIISESTEMFRYPSCTFRISNQKKTTARAVFCGDSKLCYTIQTSNWSYYSKTKKQSILFDQKSLLELGSYLLKSLGIYFERIMERKMGRKKRIQAKFDSQSFLLHNSSGLFKVRPHKKVHLKTQQNAEQEKSMNFIKHNLLPNISTQLVLPSSTRSVQHSQNKIRNQIFKNVEIIKSEEQTQPKVEEDGAGSEDSDQSEKEDMEKESFKKYMNGASKMFIEFEKAYYGDQYSAKARYELPKKVIKKKEIPIMQQACLKLKNKSQKKTLQSQKLIQKMPSSPQKQDSRNRLSKREDSLKRIKMAINQVQVLSKQDALKSLPRISIVNYMAYQDIDQKKIFRIPKIESVHIKNIRKY